jgi:50S ribosomal subunit-associated GTPase HflX
MDRPEGKARALTAARGKDQAFAISALSGDGLQELKTAIGEAVCGKIRRLQVHIPVTDGQIMAWIRSHAAIHHEEYDNGATLMMDISLPESFLHRVEAYREVPHG